MSRVDEILKKIQELSPIERNDLRQRLSKANGMTVVFPKPQRVEVGGIGDLPSIKK